MHNNKRKDKVQIDPDMREIRLLVVITSIAFFASAVIMESPDYNIIIDFFSLPLAYAQLGPTEITDVNATARLANVLVQWQHDQINTTDYTIDRGIPIGWNVTTMNNVANFTGFANSTDDALDGFFIREDGKKMYIVHNDPTEDYLDQFALSVAWDMSTLTYEKSLIIETENNVNNDIFFKPDGTIMAIQGVTNDELNYYTLSTAWDIATATHDGFVDIEGDQVPRGIWVREDGLMFWSTGTLSERVIQNNMTVAWDFSTTITDVQKITVSAQSTNPNAIEWRNDGLVFVLLHNSPTDQIDRYDLSVAWDISTAVYNSTYDLANELGDEFNNNGIQVKSDGITIFTLGGDNNDIKEWTLDDTSTNFNTIVPSVDAANGNITTTAYLDTSVNLATNYLYQVTPTNITSGLNGTGVISNSVLTNDVPDGPLDITASYSDASTVSINWTDQEFLGNGDPVDPDMVLVEYKIYDQDLGGGPFVLSGTSATNTFDLSSTFPQEKEIMIQTCNQIGCGSNSTIIQTVVGNATAPTNIITNVNATAVIENVLIQWQHDQLNTTDYFITRNGTEIVSSTGLVSNYTDTTISTNTNYIYGVTPFNDPPTQLRTNGTEAFSNVVLTSDVPDQATGLAGSYINSTAISLDWDDTTILNGGSPINPNLTLTGYILYGRDLPSGNFEVLGSENNKTLFAQGSLDSFDGGILTMDTSNIVGSTCPFPNGLLDDQPADTTNSELRISPSNSALFCARNAVEWNTTSIPQQAIITNVTFSYEIDFAQVSSFPRDCEFYQMDHQPSVVSELQSWLDAANGTEYHNTLPTICETSDSSGVEVNNADILNDFQARITDGDGWFAMGEKFRAEFRSSSQVFRSELESGTLDVEYTGLIQDSNFIDFSNFPQEREYMVAACNELGCGANSTITQILAFPITTPVLSASSDIPLGINATWTMGNPLGVENYTLFNSTDNNTFDVLATTANGTLFFFDTPHPVCYEQYYKVRASTATQNGTNSTTAFGVVDCVFTTVFTLPPSIENIGDTFKVSGSGTFVGGNLTQIAMFENGTQTDVDLTDINFTTGPSEIIPFSYLFWERDTVGGVRNFTVTVSGQNPTGVINNDGSSGFGTREYLPQHRDAIVESQGQVNFTHFRFDGEDQISLKVNRIAVPAGETWQIECIYQDVNDAIATKDSVVPEEPTVDWIGTWDNTTNTGYFNSSFSGASGSHVYISCFNDLLLFSTTSYTNSSLALFGIDAFDTSFGSLIGIPSGIFMLVLMAGMANKRTSPTWIVVITGAAGLMSVIGFFSLDPIVWGLALITAMLGMFVNQKVF